MCTFENTMEYTRHSETNYFKYQLCWVYSDIVRTKLLWPNRNFWICWIFFFFSVLSRRWNSQTSGPLASSGPQNTPVLHHRCLTFGFSLSSCTTLNIALFYLAKCRLTGHPVTCQRCGTILSSDCREPKFFAQLVSGSAVTMRQLQGETSHSYF